MCLIINKYNKEIKTAKRNMVCYKIVTKYDGNIYSTYYREKEIELGETYTSELNKEYSAIYGEVVNKGLHSFSLRREALNFVYNKFKIFDPVCVVKCIIPKGSNYYEGNFRHFNNYLKSFASDKLTYTTEVIKELLPDFKRNNNSNLL